MPLLYKTRVAMRFPAKITSSCIWVAIPVDWVILHWYACGADGRSGGRSVYGHVITKFSRMGSLPHFLIHGAPLRALRARELRNNSEKYSRLGPPCFCSFSRPLIYGFWRNEHDQYTNPLLMALLIALQVVRPSFGFHVRECMGSSSPPPAL